MCLLLKASLSLKGDLQQGYICSPSDGRNNCYDNLLKVPSCVRLRQSVTLHDNRVQCSTCCILHDEPKEILPFKYLDITKVRLLAFTFRAQY